MFEKYNKNNFIQIVDEVKGQTTKIGLLPENKEDAKVLLGVLCSIIARQVALAPEKVNRHKSVKDISKIIESQAEIMAVQMQELKESTNNEQSIRTQNNKA